MGIDWGSASDKGRKNDDEAKGNLNGRKPPRQKKRWKGKKGLTAPTATAHPRLMLRLEPARLDRRHLPNFGFLCIPHRQPRHPARTGREKLTGNTPQPPHLSPSSAITSTTGISPPTYPAAAANNLASLSARRRASDVKAWWYGTPSESLRLLWPVADSYSLKTGEGAQYAVPRWEERDVPGSSEGVWRGSGVTEGLR